MRPSPVTVFWESLKQGAVVWPYEVSPGSYFALPIAVVVPTLMILISAVAVGVYLMSSKREKNAD